MSFYTIQINDNLSFMLRERYRPRYLPPPHDSKIMSLDFGDGGNSGLVIACLDTPAPAESDSFVAVKKIPSIFYGEAPHTMKRILREIRLLRQLRGHPNIVQMRDIYLNEESGDLYLVMTMLNTDLRKDMFFAVKNKNPYGSQKTKYILYGVLKGLKYIQNRGVLHRDLKPSNILLSPFKVVICDFGHASGIRSNDEKVPNDSKYVITRMYRPPEIILESDVQTPAIDIFSVGCIFAEMLFCEQDPPVFRHLFPTNASCSMRVEGGSLRHLFHIINILGTPSTEDIPGTKSAILVLKSQQWFQNYIKPVDFGTELFPNSSKEAVSLLKLMLEFNPEKRISVEEALQSEYLQSISSRDTNESDTLFPVPENLDMSRISLPTGLIEEEEFRQSVYEEIRLFHLDNNTIII